MNIVDQSTWDDSYKNFNFYVENDKCTKKIDELYDKYVKENKIKSIFEFGCFPGRYLAHIALHDNLEANGVDITPELNDRFFDWMKSINVNIGKIKNANAFKYVDSLISNGTKYDLVYSCGFIEHFTNYLEVINYHIKLTKQNGYIIICTPNFRGGYQRVMHRWLDKPNYNNHVNKSMNPKEWKKLFLENNCEVLEYGYFGNFDFWVDKYPKNPIKKFITLGNYFLARHNHLPNCNFYSPYCYIIARKK